MNKNGKKLSTGIKKFPHITLSRKHVPAKKPKRMLLGRYIIADPRICHGKPTFRGTRIMVADVLEMVSNGMAWESIIEEWNGHITSEAITEAVNLARQAFIKRIPEFSLESAAA